MKSEPVPIAGEAMPAGATTTNCTGRPRRAVIGWPVWLAAITLLAALLRTVWLATIPPGLFFDVAANLFDVLDILGGARPIWFPRNNGREPLMLYAQAIAALVWGPTPLAAKAAAAVFGIATVPAMYLFGREAAARLGDARARQVGLLAAFLTATMYWHVHFSRLGLRTITLPLFLALGLGLLLRAFRRDSLPTALAAGLAMGAATYTYTSIRLAPLAIAPYLAIVLVAHRRTRNLVLGTAFLVVWVSVSAPLGIYYVKHPIELEGRTTAVSVLNAEVSGGDPFHAAARGLLATAASTVWHGSESGLENLPGRPLFEPLTAAAFLLGTGLALAALTRRSRPGGAPALLVLAMLGAMALSPALSVNPPGFVRISGMVPPALVLAALGYAALGRWLRPRLRGAWPIAVVAGLAVPLVWTTFDYVVRWGSTDLAYRWVMEDKVQGADDVRGWLGAGERVFLAPLYARDYTYTYLLRDRPSESFDLGAGLVVPANGPARYVFPPEDRTGLATVAERLEGQARFEMVADRSGERPLLATLVLETPPGFAGQPIARFEHGVELMSALVSLPSPASAAGGTVEIPGRFAPRTDVVVASARPGEAVDLALTWRAAAPVDRDYSVFVHGRLGERTQFQRDRMPGDGSLPTSRWQPGDRIGDYYRIELPRELPAGEYRIMIGLYELSSGQRLRLLGEGEGVNEVEAGRIRVTA